MAWSTVIALAILLAFAGGVVRFIKWKRKCEEVDELDCDIEDAVEALEMALREEPHNLQLHLQLRSELVRLQKRRDAFG